MVAQQKNPATIDALIPFLDTGTRVVSAVAAFGEFAVGNVVAVAGGSGGATQSQVSSALFTLQRMLTGPVDNALSDASKRMIVEVTGQRLQGIQSPAVVIRAIELDAVTRDPNLFERIRTLAENPAAVQDMGIADSSLIGRVQQKATAALIPGAR